MNRTVPAESVFMSIATHFQGRSPHLFFFGLTVSSEQRLFITHLGNRYKLESLINFILVIVAVLFDTLSNHPAAILLFSGQSITAL